jgi:phage terminase small subunit
MAAKKLTAKQKKFVEAYVGNATEAAKLAGYSEKTAKAIGHENLTKPNLLEAVEKRQEKEINKLIADRKERQEFWSKIMRDGATSSEIKLLFASLKASELLGKSEADFTEKIEHSGDPYEGWTKEQLLARYEELKKKTKTK